RRETELLFETIVREDRSVLDLLGARYTFVNERLARHYGIPDIYGSHFRRITLDDDSVRGGLLGQGSILTITSYPDRTSPVQRGQWILENLPGAGPPPPPPNVPALEEKAPDGKVLSMRQRMDQHRANPVCATCHSRMDPVGLSLENFDAVGRWRDKGESNAPIDATGALPDGTSFNGPRELRTALLEHPEMFVNTLTEKLLTYSVGRGLEYYDAPTVRAIVREASAVDYKFSTLVAGIVNSPAFQMRAKGKPEKLSANSGQRSARRRELPVMFITQLALPRGAVPRGLGATLALPLLDAMVPALSALARPPASPAPRLGFIYVPNGAVMDKWKPTGVGKDFELSQVLSPLAPFKTQVNVVSGLA